MSEKTNDFPLNISSQKKFLKRKDFDTGPQKNNKLAKMNQPVNYDDSLNMSVFDTSNAYKLLDYIKKKRKRENRTRIFSYDESETDKANELFNIDIQPRKNHGDVQTQKVTTSKNQIIEDHPLINATNVQKSNPIFKKPTKSSLNRKTLLNNFNKPLYSSTNSDSSDSHTKIVSSTPKDNLKNKFSLNISPIENITFSDNQNIIKSIIIPVSRVDNNSENKEIEYMKSPIKTTAVHLDQKVAKHGLDSNDDNMDIVDKNITSMKNIKSNKLNKTKNAAENMSISKNLSLLDEINITNLNDNELTQVQSNNLLSPKQNKVINNNYSTRDNNKDQPDDINYILSEKQVNAISHVNQLSIENSNKKQSQSVNNICTTLEIRANKEAIKNSNLSAHAVKNDILILNSQCDKEKMKDSNISVELLESLFPLKNHWKKLKSPPKPAPKKSIPKKKINVHATELDNTVKQISYNKTIGTSKRKLYSKDNDENINLESLHEAINSDKDTLEEQDRMITKQLTPLLIDVTNQQNQRDRDNLQSITRYRSNKNSLVIQDEVVSKQVTPCFLPASNNNKNNNKDIQIKDITNKKKSKPRKDILCGLNVESILPDKVNETGLRRSARERVPKIAHWSSYKEELPMIREFKNVVHPRKAPLDFNRVLQKMKDKKKSKNIDIQNNFKKNLNYQQSVRDKDYNSHTKPCPKSQKKKCSKELINNEILTNRSDISLHNSNSEIENLEKKDKHTDKPCPKSFKKYLSKEDNICIDLKESNINHHNLKKDLRGIFDNDNENPESANRVEYFDNNLNTLNAIEIVQVDCEDIYDNNSSCTLKKKKNLHKNDKNKKTIIEKDKVNHKTLSNKTKPKKKKSVHEIPERNVNDKDIPGSSKLTMKNATTTTNKTAKITSDSGNISQTNGSYELNNTGYDYINKMLVENVKNNNLTNEPFKIPNSLNFITNINDLNFEEENGVSMSMITPYFGFIKFKPFAIKTRTRYKDRKVLLHIISGKSVLKLNGAKHRLRPDDIVSLEEDVLFEIRNGKDPSFVFLVANFDKEGQFEIL